MSSNIASQILRTSYSAEVKEILQRYPDDQKRSAVMPLLFLSQKEGLQATVSVMSEIAQIIDISITQVASIVGFYTLYYAHPGGKNRIQICTDLPCALRGADDFADKVCEKLGVKLGETTEDGEFTVESVMCLAACDKAPMFQVQNGDGISYHERQTIADVQTVIEQLSNAGTHNSPKDAE